MNASEVLCFLYSYLAGLLLLCLWSAVRSRSRYLLIVALILVGMIFATSIVSVRLAGSTPIGSLWTTIVTNQPRLALAAVAGLCTAFACIALQTNRYGGESERMAVPGWGGWFRTIAAVSFLSGTVVAVTLLAWDQVNDIQLTQPRVLDDSLTIRKVAELPMPPIRIAAENNGKFYVSAYFTNDGGQYGGVIYKYEPSPESELYSGRIVSSSHVLYRPFGLAVSGDELYVSRSGHAAWANHGEITDKSCGAITCLRDLDCDGYFEYMNDIARDLPGAGGPDTMHQNNGIAIHDDDLYVALAMNSDRDPDERVNSGTVLKVNLKNGRQEVVAEGFRNPFGIAVNSVGDIFVTDNDPGDGHGDELNYVIRGEHYGHPYVTTTDPPTKASGFQEPIFISDPDSNFAGIAFASGKHVPASLRNRLLLCDFGNNRVLSLALERKDGIYKCVDVQVLATVHTPVDISVAQDGVIYVASRFYKAVYAIEPKEQELYQTE